MLAKMEIKTYYFIGIGGIGHQCTYGRYKESHNAENQEEYS